MTDIIDVDVRPYGPSGSLLTTATGRRFEVDKTPAELRVALADYMAAPDRPAWPELAAMLREAGGIAAPDPVPAPLTVLVDATLAPIAEALLGAEDIVTALPDDLTPIITSAQGTLVLIRDRFDPALLGHLETLCDTHQIAWTQLHIDLRRGWAGPAIDPTSALRYSDVLTRRLCATQRRELGEALVAPAAIGPLRLPPRETLTWMLGVFLTEVRRWASGRDSALVGNEIELDHDRPALTLHPILPLPNTKTDSHYRNDRITGTDLLRDSRTGVITNLRTISHHRSLPRELKTVQAEVTDMSRVLPWAPNTVCGGSVFGDSAAAQASAIGEGVERYCGNVIDKDALVHASWNELVGRDENALDPHSLVLYSAKQHATPGFPFVEFDHDLPVYWSLGTSITTGKPTWVPSSTVYVNWYVGPFADEPKTNYPFYAGLAAGSSLDDAIRSGLEEIVERDTTMLWWANRHPLPTIEPSHRMHGLFDGLPPEEGQKYWLVHLPNKFGIPVIAGIVEHTVENRFAIGFGARDNAEDAALKAWAEALTLQEISRDLDDPDGRYWNAVRDGVKAQNFMKRWRADRRYIDDYRADFHDVGDLECQMQFYLDTRATETAKKWVLSGESIPLTSIPSLPDRTLRTIQRRIEEHGYEIVVVDITTPDVAASGLRVVRVLVPGLVSNYPAAFPFNGRRRLQDGPVDLGWRTDPLDETELNLHPLPHA
jgi:ribosomal protein S12 methylthiotransferase accessory factor